MKTANERRPQIAEWVIMTYLAYQHSRMLSPPAILTKSMRAHRFSSIYSVPTYLDNQKKAHWDRDTHDLDTVDVVQQRM